MSTDCLKLENNLCRCCHAEGSFKTLGVTIGIEGREVYADMLRIYLDVNLTPVPGPLCLVTYTICEECVQRLYDAVDFKKQILECEERFRDMYRRDVIKACKPDVEVKVEVDATDIPSTFVEELKVECPPEPNETQDDTDFEYQDVIEVDAPEETAKESVTIKEQDSKKEEDSKKKDKGKGKAKVVKTGKKVGRPKKSESSDAEKKTKKGPVLTVHVQPEYSVVENGNNKKYLCHKCDALLSTVYTMRHHILDQHTEAKCLICDERFTTSSKRKKHILTVHNMKEFGTGEKKTLRPAIQYKCDQCNKVFVDKKILRYHILTIHIQKKCSDCNLRFTSREMAVHKHDVHGVLMPSCGVCGFKSISRARVATHQRQVHLKEKNVSCEHCSMMFYDRVELKKHLIRHFSEKKYECEYCHKKFPRKSTLRMHERIHTGEKNKVCPYCNERFVQKSSLNYHLSKHHPDAC